MQQSIRYISLLLLSFGMISCGDLFTNKKAESDLQFADGGCDGSFDTEAFSRIMEENIHEEIYCLQKSMEMFMDVVKTDRPGFLAKKEIREFVMNQSNIDDDTIAIIDSVFDIGFIIFGGDLGYIKRNDVKKLTDFLKHFNSQIIPVYKRFISEENVGYEAYNRERDIVRRNIGSITDELRNLVNTDREGEVHEIDTMVFLNNFFKDEPNTLNEILSLMFLKRVFLGGENLKLNHFEFQIALEKLSRLSVVAFDFIKAKNFLFKENQHIMMGLYKEDVSIFRNSIAFFSDSDESLFSVDHVLNAVETLAPDINENIFGNAANNTDYKISDYRNEIISILPAFIGRKKPNARNRNDEQKESEFVTAEELYVVLEHVYKLLERGDYLYRIYNLYEDEVDTLGPLSIEVDYPRAPDVAKEFSKIANNYKFLKGKFKSPTFDYKFHRNADAFVEVATFEYGLKQVMAYFGKKDDRARGGYHMTYDETYAVIMKVRRFLRDLGIINIGRKGGNEVAGTADNLVLMSTLFQFQSNGCDKNKVCMEIPELTEFLIGLVSAMSIKDFFIKEMKAFCSNEVDQYGRIQVGCFRKNFINVLDTPNLDDGGRTLADYMPEMAKYIRELVGDSSDVLSSNDYVRFIAETENFTRTCTHNSEGELLAMKGTDAFAVFAGLLNLESTFLRLDTDQNGVMDGKRKRNNEVMWAYNNVYKGAIQGLVAPNGGFMKKLAKPIFKYLVKYGTVPDTSKFSSVWKFIKFLVKFNKRADASRMTIASILKTLGEQSDTAIKFPFKCECVEGPVNNCVPEDGAWE